MEYEHITHGFPPVYDSDSRVLILGSLPSVKSREQQFYYGHPQNRFWRVLATVTGKPVPVTVEQKKEFLLDSGIALYDAVYECDIAGSSDSSIRNISAARWRRLPKQRAGSSSRDARLSVMIPYRKSWTRCSGSVRSRMCPLYVPVPMI